MKPLIKWPGGKGRLIKEISPMIPNYERYLEPFLGGGALFFSQEPKSSCVNDLSSELISFYRCVQQADGAFLSNCLTLASLFAAIGEAADDEPDYDSRNLAEKVIGEMLPCPQSSGNLVRFFDAGELESSIVSCLMTARRRTTAVRAAFYYLVRDEYNSLVKEGLDGPYVSALFFILRELCFGSMFRYNSSGGFNIPYGGFSYDRKNLSAKVDNLYKAQKSDFYSASRIKNEDFRLFFKEERPSEADFIFLDPPYDSNFSDYSGNSFTRQDHKDLRDLLTSARAGFVLVVGRTDFIDDIYMHSDFLKRSLPSSYSYSMLGRNNKKVDYLIITKR